MRSLALFCCLALLPTAALADDFSSLEERMSYNDFKAAGLDKLSPEELAHLNAWLRQKASSTLAPAAAAPAAHAPSEAQGDTRGLRLPTASGETIVSRIPGEFRGWSGRTRITLENGQVWETFPENNKLTVNLTDPTVRIEPGMFGAWYLKVDGYNASAKVKRIQ